MGKRMPVPKELEHLIEKRDAEQDRRSGTRRRKTRPPADRRQKRRRKSDG
jgi:hypothetical protein